MKIIRVRLIVGKIFVDDILSKKKKQKNENQRMLLLLLLMLPGGYDEILRCLIFIRKCQVH